MAMAAAVVLIAGCGGPTDENGDQAAVDLVGGGESALVRTGPDRAGAARGGLTQAETGAAERPDELLFDPGLAVERASSFDDPAHWGSGANDGNGGTGLLPVVDPSFPSYDGLGLAPTSHVATVFGDGVASTVQPGDGVLAHWFGNPTQFGGDRVFLVLDQTSSPDFIKVSLPLKPNGQEGWIPRDAVVISEVEHRAVVDLANDSLTVWRGDDVIVQTKAVTGKPATPTPVGQFFVRDIIAHNNPGGAYGPYIVALSGFSEALETFAGGLPAIAIHGTNNPGLVGQERSNGCIRIPNDLVTALAATVPLGTPVTVVA